MPHDEHPIVERLLKLNAARALAHFERRHRREQFLQKHPVHLIDLGCMDGRDTEQDKALGFPPGCSDQFKTGGGRFDIGSNYFSSQLMSSIESGISRDLTVLILVSSHYSSHHTTHGCRAFNNDRCAAHRHALHLADKIRYAVQLYTPPVDVLPVEFDTDIDSIKVYGEEGVLDTMEYLTDDRYLATDLFERVPSLAHAPVQKTLAWSLRYNVRHVRSVLHHKRHLRDFAHAETVLFFGRGVSWLNARNDAITIFPDGDDLDKNIVTGLEILRGNKERNPVLKKFGPVILCSAAYWDNRRLYFAMEQSNVYARRMQRLLTKFKDLKETILVGTYNREAQVFTPHNRIQRH